jgi:uncharacterized DUF497 family protein
VDLDLLEGCEGFDWDEGNLHKNRDRHGVEFWECEEIFFNRPLVVSPDSGHSQQEVRHYCLGKTDAGRRLFVVFTVRNERIRVISARDMSRRERKEYRRHEEDDPYL